MVIVRGAIMNRLMECDAVTDNDNVVDLSSSITTSTTNSRSQLQNETNGRILRPRNEIRNYAESPERLLNGMNNITCTNFYESENYLTNGICNSDDEDLYSKFDRVRFNNKKKICKFTYLNSRSIVDKQVEGDSDSSVDDYSPLPSPPLLKPEDSKMQETLRRLRDELRTEEMKLLLLNKLRNSQLQFQHSLSTQLQDKETNSDFLSHHIIPPTILPSGLSITPATTKASSVNKHCSSSGKDSMTISKSTTISRGNLMFGKINSNSAQNRGLNISVPQPPNRLFNSSNTSRSNSLSNFTAVAKELQPSVTITPAPPPGHKDRNRDENQTPAQHKAAAKLALRKQLEKTLLQMSPPKPPAPEMHFIPNPSNSEFIYLLGLEVVVDYITNENRTQPEQKVHPIFKCCQCKKDFTPVWKPDVVKNRNLNESHMIFYHPQNFTDNGIEEEHSVLCEECVTKNVKKVLKAEHTNRLKTAFIKALQQEQEIDQNLAQNGTTPSPVSSPDNIQLGKSTSNNQNISSTSIRHIPTPPVNASLRPPQTPSPRHVVSSSSNHNANSSSNNSSSTSSVAVTAVADQAMQILRGLTSSQSVIAGNAHLPSLSHLLYPYQLAMVQGAVSSATSSTSATINNSNSNNNKTLPAITNPPFTLADLQRFADIQKQCLMNLMPFQLTSTTATATTTVTSTATSSSSTKHSNWKT